jgi:hypothetical protein
MRQLFLPACICLVTWSGATSSDTGVTLDEFTSRRQIAAEPSPVKMASLDTGDVGITHIEDASAVVAIPREDAAPPTADEIAALVPNLPAEYPVPSGKVINNGIPTGVPLPPVPKPVVDRSEDEVCHALAMAAERNDVPAPFFIRLLFQESKFRPEVVSSAGAQGIAQFMPGTANDMGLDNPYDPLQAIPASARMLGSLIRQFGNLGLAAAAYNAGPKRVADWLAAKGKTKLPDETQGYVKTITGNPIENWSASSARYPAQKVPEEAPCQHVAGLLAANGPDALPLPTPSPLRASIKVADKGHQNGPAKADDRKPAAEKKTPDIKIIAAEPNAKKNGRVALGAGKDRHKDKDKGTREEVRLTIKPAAKADIKSEPNSEPKVASKAASNGASKSVSKADHKPEPRKDAPKREKIAQR